MKKLLFVLLLVGCSSNEIKIEDKSTDVVDSVIIKSQQNLINANEINKRGDSSITGKVEKTVQKIQVMEQQITQLKEENNELKDKLNDVNDAGEHFELLPVSNN